MRVGEKKGQRNERLFGTSSPVAFVTGSHAARVGSVIASLFEANGFRVVRHAHRDPGPQSGGMLLNGAIEDEETCLLWSEKIMSTYGRIDVAVNSAAIWDNKALEELKAVDFKRQFDVNALGTALICKNFGLIMVNQKTGGSIVNIGDWAIRRPYPGFAAYFASKAAVKGITESMAIELATRNGNVRVNSVLPGPVLYDESVAPEKREQIAKSCLLQRNGSAEDVADAVLYLATAPFVTGVMLPVDGGRTVFSGQSTDSLAHPGS